MISFTKKEVGAAKAPAPESAATAVQEKGQGTINSACPGGGNGDKGEEEGLQRSRWNMLETLATGMEPRVASVTGSARNDII